MEMEEEADHSLAEASGGCLDLQMPINRWIKASIGCLGSRR